MMILFILYYIIAPFFVFGMINKIYPDSTIKQFNVLISLITGPLLFTLINYYSLLIPFSNNNYAFYLFFFVITLIVITSLIWVIKGSFNSLLKLNKKELLIFYVALLLLIPLFTLKPIAGHDFIEYCLFGKMLATRGTINWSNYWYDAQSGFYYVGLHGFSFPLFGSIEVWLSNKMQVVPKFLLIKSVTIYYALIIIANAFFLFSYLKKNLFWHFLVLLFSSFYFFTFVTNFHIDTYRTSLLLLCITFLFLIFENKIKIDLNIFALICGMAAFTHSLNAIVLFVSFFIPFIFIKNKAGKILVYFLVLFFSGYIHYFLDVVFGAGWIFKEIKFY